MKSPAIGLIELNSIARGILLHDLMVKKAQIDVLQSHSICPGKYIILIAGGVAPVRASMREGLHYGGAAVVDSLLIPNVSTEIFPAMLGAVHDLDIDSVVIVETFSVSASVTLADLALKHTAVKLLDMRLAQGLGGKAYFILVGPLPEAEEAERWVREQAEPGMLANTELIPAPDEAFADTLIGRIL